MHGETPQQHASIQGLTEDGQTEEGFSCRFLMLEAIGPLKRLEQHERAAKAMDTTLVMTARDHASGQARKEQNSLPVDSGH